jgi:hypothetical protein
MKNSRKKLVSVPGTGREVLVPVPYGYDQCCGSEFIFFGFGSRNFFGPFRIRIWILRLILWHDNFLKSGSDCNHMYRITEPVGHKKALLYKKAYRYGTFCSLQVFNLWFSELFLFYCSIWIRIRTFFSNSFRIRPKLLDSFGFGFLSGSTTPVLTIINTVSGVTKCTHFQFELNLHHVWKSLHESNFV